MAIYTNLKANNNDLHGIFESSNLKSTDIGNLYDALVKNAEGKEIDVDNGVALKIGAYTGNGLQERNATIAGVGDKIAVTGTPALNKAATTKGQEQPYNFYNVAGKDAKAYEVVNEDIFAVASYQFTNETEDGDTDFSVVKKDAYVVVDGRGKWTAQASVPSADTYGFIGQVHSISVGTFYTVVRIFTVQNVQK